MSTRLLLKSRYLVPLACLWLLVYLPAQAHPPAFQQAPAITYLRYDVEIELKPEGNFIVREIQEIEFGGEFRTAFAEIPRDYTSDITNILLLEGEIPYKQQPYATSPGTFSVQPNSSQNTLDIEWGYGPTEPGEVRTFILQYEVSGGLWVYPEETVLEWRAVPADRSGIPVQASRVTVTLPAEIDPAQLNYTAYGPSFEAQASANQVIFTSNEAIPDGTQFQVQVGFPPALVPAGIQPWQIAEDTARLEYRFEALDVHLEIQPEGQLKVTEQHRVTVEAGAMYSGNRAIRLAYLDEIKDIQLFEGDQPFSSDPADCPDYCFAVTQPSRPLRWIYYSDFARAVIIDDQRAGELLIDWEFPPLVKGEATTFRLQYQVLGAISQAEDHQRLNWTVVFPGRVVPVESASLTVELPPGVAWEEVFIEGGRLRRRADGSTVIVHPGPIAPGESWRIDLLLPAGATQAPQPAWQRTLAEAQATAQAAEIRRARLQLGAGVTAFLLLMVGVGGAWLAWYRWGRDSEALVALDYLSTPPSNLPPGIVAYLLNEQPTPKGVLASLFHLGSLGLLRLDLEGELRLQLNWPQELAEGQTLQTPDGGTMTIPDHLVALFNALRPHLSTTSLEPLHRITEPFQQALPAVYAEMATEATRFFTELPETARHRWLVLGQWLVLGSLIGSLISWYLWVEEIGWVALAPTLALLPGGIAFILISRWMPQRTAGGVEEAARWQAFERYLRRLKEYGNLAEAQQILDNSFAYAVALGIEEIVLEQAESLGATMPAWVYPAHLEPDLAAPSTISGTPRPLFEPGRSGQPLPPLRLVRSQPAPAAPSTPEAASPGTGGEALPRLSLQGLSRQLGQSLDAASARVGQLLNTAAQTTREDTPFTLIRKGAGEAGKLTWKIGTSTGEIIGDILESAASGSGSGGYSGSSSSGSRSRSSWSSSSSRSRSSFSSGRSSSSRRSGGGGRRGFG